MTNAKEPIIVGVGQLTNRATQPSEALEPMELMERTARLAAEDAEAPGLLAELDSITIINVLSHPYADPPAQLAGRLGAAPSQRLYTSLGGNSPQWRVNETADRIARGEVRLALISGAEALHSLNLARKAGVSFDWGPKGEAAEVVGETRGGSNKAERAHEVHLPIRVFPLFENALRAKRGWSIERHAQYIADLCGQMSAQAADNPHAWFRDGKDAATIGTRTPTNRMICFPYLKFMNAIMNLDQSASLLMTNVETARRLQIPESKWVYVRGCGDAQDHWYISQRQNFFTSPALHRAGELALEQAGRSIDDIEVLDLYSCFPAAVQMAAEMLGIPTDDSRPQTVTGGLPYHGGPGSNYSTHAIACLVERLRRRAGSFGLATGVGWYFTKHSVGVYSTEPPAGPWRRHDVESDQRDLDAMPQGTLCERADGAGTIETYTVVHDREGAPSVGLAAFQIEDGRRCWARVHDVETLNAMEEEEFVGKPGRIRFVEADNTHVLEL